MPRYASAEKSGQSCRPRSDRLLERFRERRKEFRAGRGHVPAVFQPYAELSWDVQSRLIGKTHAGRQGSFVVAHQIRRFMTVHADPVAGAVRQARQAVVFAPALLLVERPYRTVDAAGWRA